MLRKTFTLASVIIVLLTSVLSRPAESGGRGEPARLRNIGRAYYEEDEYEEALKMFQRCLALLPDSAIDEVNLGMVLVQLGRYKEARMHLAKGEKLDGSLAPYVSYNRAITYKREKRFAETAKEFDRMRKLAPTCPDTAYNSAVVYESLGELQKTFAELSRAVDLAPDMIAPHYRRMIVAMRLGKREIAIAERNIFTELRAADSRTRTAEELERSMYTEILEPERARPAPTAPIVENPLGVRFENVTAEVGLSPGGTGKQLPARQPLCWSDIDGDERPDLLFLKGSSEQSLELWRNRGDAGFEEISRQAGLLTEEMLALAAAFGDLDHDGDNDLCVADGAGIWVFFNQGNGKFVRAAEKVPIDEGKEPAELLLVDFDHEGDLDLYVAFRSAPPVMYRNEGKGTFVVVPDEAGLSGDGTPASRLCLVDFDDDNDVDFFLSHPGGANQLLSSMRMGSFKDVARRLRVEGPVNPRNVEIADINNDGWSDIVLLQEKGELGAKLGTRSGTFTPQELAKVESISGALAVLDYDNDGDEDIFAAGRLLQNDGKFSDVSEAVGLKIGRADGLLQAVAEDFDADGDLDVAVCWRDGRLALFRNQGGNRNRWIRVSLEGLQSNRFGISTKVEVRDGAFFQEKICMGGPLLFGLDRRKSLDVLRLWWPTGVAQNILSPKVLATANVREKLGPPSSCPFVYVWDGGKFSFLTDVLDGAPLGVPLGDGSFLPYRSKEDLLIPGSRLRRKEGRLVIQLTGELRELVYLDRATLTAVDHPSDSALYPDDCVGPPGTGKTRLYSVGDLRPPVSAVEDRGKDIGEILSQLDGRHAAGFGLTRFHGLAEKHTIELEFAGLSEMKQPVLVLTGWIEWIDGDTLYALGQGAGPLPVGPILDVQRPDGHWQQVNANIGVPAGIGKNVVAELPRRLCGEKTRLRITTNLEVYWDRIAAGDAGGSAPLSIHALKPFAADLHFRGFSQVVRGNHSEPPWYDYDKVSARAPYKPQQGLLTRYGDTLPLLAETDDLLVIFGPGDELTLTYSPPPRVSPGQTRDFILRLDGWIKDANPSTFAGDRVEPLPYRAMKGYPFGAEEGIVDDPSYAEYLSHYNTRRLKRDAVTLRWSGPTEQ